MSKLDTFIEENWPVILSGNLLCIDPATGATSQPGYAIYESGLLKESGIISLPGNQPISVRLHLLCKSLQDQFEVPDVLAVEQIAPRIGGRAATSLHWSIGVTMAALPCPLVVEVSSRSWQMHVDLRYQKDDEIDAIYIGKCLLERAGKYL